jgi:hypothetical protein
MRKVVRLRDRVPNPDGTGGYVPGDYMQLDGWVGRAQVRKAAGDPNLSAEIAVVVRDQAEFPGAIELSLTAAQTWNLDARTYKWDLLLTSPSGDANTYLEGDIVVAPGVTAL